MVIYGQVFICTQPLQASEDMAETELKSRIPTTEHTRDELKLLVVKSDTASSYDELLQEFINQHAE